MNERIKSLVYEAEKYALNKANDHDGDEDYENTFEDDFQEKFAELLAQEAADVAYNTYWNNPDKVRGAHLKQAIQQHFGVRS